MRFRGLHVFTMTTALMTFPGVVASARAQSGVREVSATERGVIPLQTRLRYTTMVILPDGEEASFNEGVQSFEHLANQGLIGM